MTQKSSAAVLSAIEIENTIQALADLYVARRTVMIYPLSHEQVKRAVVRAFKSLVIAMGARPDITLAVMKDTIGTGSHILRTKNAKLTELAGVMKSYGIATVTVKKGLDIKELVNFLQLLATDPESLSAEGDITEVARQRNLPSIQVQAVDYSKLQVTEELEIRRADCEEADHCSIWQQFVTQLMKRPTDADSPYDPQVDPGHLAGMLNRRALDVQQVMRHFESSFVKVVKAGREGQFLGDELSKFKQMIEDLGPELKGQFLSATFRHFGNATAHDDDAELLEGLGSEFIIRMLRQASSAGQKISPSLLAFTKKMGYLKTPTTNPQDGSAEGGNPQGLSCRSVETLLSHEHYDAYVDPDYEQLLDNLTRNERAVLGNDDDRTLARQIEKGLTDTEINIHVGRSISRLMTRSADISSYRDWARQLTFMLDDLIESRAFSYLTRLIEFARKEQGGEDEERAEIAGLVLARFSDPQFVAKVIENVASSMGELETTGSDPQILGFLMELGEPVVVEIFDGLDPRETFEEQGLVTQLLKSLTTLTAREAVERLNDPRPEYVQRMMRIIRKMGDGDSAQQVKSLLDHTNVKVRMEALSTLLSFNNKWGVIRLRELLEEPSGEDYASAADLAGRYRVRSVVPQLLAMAAKRKEPEYCEPAIRALARIGDPQAVPALKKIARRRWSMGKNQDLHLKLAVFESLGGYPREAVQDLLHIGLKSKDDEIRSACEQLLRTGSRAAESKDKHADASGPP